MNLRLSVVQLYELFRARIFVWRLMILNMSDLDEEDQLPLKKRYKLWKTDSTIPVVIAMRDLFQVVFELKKKEIELAKLHIDQKVMKYHPSGIVVEPQPDTKGVDVAEGSSPLQNRELYDVGKMNDRKENRSGIMADLLDLQFELHSLQQGIHQMDKLSPENPLPALEDLLKPDPFGDSFTNITVKGPAQSILPPPPSSTKRSHSDRQYNESAQSSLKSNTTTLVPNRTPTPTSNQLMDNEEKHLSDTENTSLTGSSNDRGDKGENFSISPFRTLCRSPQIDVFTELDPLGTGLRKPYVDKKDFFQHLKNPPKKVLKDLATINSHDTFPTNFDSSINLLEPIEVLDNPVDASAGGDFACFDQFVDCKTHPIRKSQSPKIGIISRSIHHQQLSVLLPPEEILSAKSFDALERKNSESTISSINLPSLNIYPFIHKGEVDNDSSTSCRTQSTEKFLPVESTSNIESPGSPMRSCSSDANSRLSISSAELENIPEPPPRDSRNILVNPPPLPPKKQSSKSTKPPPRPPHYDIHSQYDFVGNDGISLSLTNKDQTIKSVGSGGKYEFAETFASSSTQPQAPYGDDPTTFLSSKFEDSFDSNLPTSSSLFHNSHSCIINPNGFTQPSLDIISIQSKSPNFSELASNLDIPLSELTTLTLHQLAKCLAKLSSKEKRTTSRDNVLQESSTSLFEKKTSFTHGSLLKTDCRNNNESQKHPSYDKYAVIREFSELEQDKTSDSEAAVEVRNHESQCIGETSMKQKINGTDTKMMFNIDIDSNSGVESISMRMENENGQSISDEQVEELPDIILGEMMKIPTTSPGSISEDTDIRTTDECKAEIEICEDLKLEETTSRNHPNSDTMKSNNGGGVYWKSDDESQSTFPRDRYAALREIIVEIDPIAEDTKHVVDSASLGGSITCTIDQDLMKLFSVPSSQTSSPKKKDNEQNRKEAATDIFEGIRMMNSDINHSASSVNLEGGFGDVSPSYTHDMKKGDETKHKPNWAKFEMNVPNPGKRSNDGHCTLSGMSPWSPEDEGYRKKKSLKPHANRHSDDSDNEWQDDEGSKEMNGRLRNESLWSRYPHFDSSYEGNYFHNFGLNKDRRPRGRSTKKLRGIPTIGVESHRPRTNEILWHGRKRWEAEHSQFPMRSVPCKKDEERKLHWSYETDSRPPWDREIPRTHEHPNHDHGDWNRREILWDENDKDCFDSRESISYENDEIWSRRGYARRRWENDERLWGERSDDDYTLFQSNHIHCCRKGRGGSINYFIGKKEPYSSQRRDYSPRYLTRKTQWPRRPSSANDDRDTAGVFVKPKRYDVPRSECDDNDSELCHRPYRSKSRDDYQESDPEFENWNDRLYRSEGLDTHSEFSHRRKMSRKQVMEFEAQGSRFEDDFTQTNEHPMIDSAGTDSEFRSDISSMSLPIPRDDRDYSGKDFRKYQLPGYYEDDLGFNDDTKRYLGLDEKEKFVNSSCQPQNSLLVRSVIPENKSGGSFPSGSKGSDDVSTFEPEAAESKRNSSLVGHLRNSKQMTCSNNRNQNLDIKKSESFNIFVRENDPFDDDDFFT